jgi:hypothetical protein
MESLSLESTNPSDLRSKYEAALRECLAEIEQYKKEGIDSEVRARRIQVLRSRYETLERLIKTTDATTSSAPVTNVDVDAVYRDYHYAAGMYSMAVERMERIQETDHPNKYAAARIDLRNWANRCFGLGQQLCSLGRSTYPPLTPHQYKSLEYWIRWDSVSYKYQEAVNKHASTELIESLAKWMNECQRDMVAWEMERKFDEAIRHFRMEIKSKLKHDRTNPKFVHEFVTSLCKKNRDRVLAGSPLTKEEIREYQQQFEMALREHNKVANPSQRTLDGLFTNATVTAPVVTAATALSASDSSINE